MEAEDRIESVRRRIAELPGTQEEKAREIGVQLTWLSKFLRNQIAEPRLSRLELLESHLRKAQPAKAT